MLEQEVEEWLPFGDRRKMVERLLERIIRRPEKPIEEEVFESLSFSQGRSDYLRLASGQEIKRQIVTGGKTHELDWLRFYGRPEYVERFRAVLRRAEEKREEGVWVPSLRLKSPTGPQFLPLSEEAIKNIRQQLLGFGWQALEKGDLSTAYSAFRGSGFLNEAQVVQRLRDLVSQDERVRGSLRYRLRLEQATETRAKNRLKKEETKKTQRAMARAHQSLKVLKAIFR